MVWSVRPEETRGSSLNQGSAGGSLATRSSRSKGYGELRSVYPERERDTRVQDLAGTGQPQPCVRHEAFGTSWEAIVEL